MKSSNREVWKEIEGFSGYFISSKGNVKSLRTGVERYMKLRKNSHGYLSVRLYSNKRKQKHFLIHRLVAMSFLLNDYEKPQVNHIDGDKTNNNLSNLEWVTAKENIDHAYSNGLRNDNQLKLNGKLNAKRVSQIDITTSEIIKVWESIKSTEKQSEGTFDSSAVHRCCKLKKDTHKGFRWRYEGEEGLEFKFSKKSKGIPVEVEIDNSYTVYDSADHAAADLKVTRNTIYRCINSNRKLFGKYSVEYA